MTKLNRDFFSNQGDVTLGIMIRSGSFCTHLRFRPSPPYLQVSERSVCFFQEKLDLQQPVARRASVLLGIGGHKMALEYIKTEVDKREIKQLLILSDSQSAVGILMLGWENKSHKRVVAELQQTIKNLRDKGLQIQINWTPGHAEVTGNVIADRLTKQVAEEAKRMPEVTVGVTI